jgi:hypothetical protein
MSNTTRYQEKAETAWQKTVRKAGEEPMVPVGALIFKLVSVPQGTISTKADDFAHSLAYR